MTVIPSSTLGPFSSGSTVRLLAQIAGLVAATVLVASAMMFAA